MIILSHSIFGVTVAVADAHACKIMLDLACADFDPTLAFGNERRATD